MNSNNLLHADRRDRQRLVGRWISFGKPTTRTYNDRWTKRQLTVAVGTSSFSKNNTQELSASPYCSLLHWMLVAASPFERCRRPEVLLNKDFLFRRI